MKKKESISHDKPKNMYKCMMEAIQSKHARGNTIRYFKLPLILLNSHLYGGAISQFYLLTLTVESVMDEKTKKDDNEMICFLRDGLGLESLASGYELDLAQLFGSPEWKKIVNTVTTAATQDYIYQIKNASDIEICSIVFILYGALVVGGGKATQKKARKVIKNCDHVLFDFSENMVETRKKFKDTFYQLGVKYPQHFDEYVKNAERFMSRNNDVVLSIQCFPSWWLKALVGGITVALGLGIASKS